MKGQPCDCPDCRAQERYRMERILKAFYILLGFSLLALLILG